MSCKISICHVKLYTIRFVKKISLYIPDFVKDLKVFDRTVLHVFLAILQNCQKIGGFWPLKRARVTVFRRFVTVLEKKLLHGFCNFFAHVPFPAVCTRTPIGYAGETTVQAGNPRHRNKRLLCGRKIPPAMEAQRARGGTFVPPLPKRDWTKFSMAAASSLTNDFDHDIIQKARKALVLQHFYGNFMHLQQ